MAKKDEIALMAHLMRRAGFSASRDELEARVANGYDATVEELLDPEAQPPVDPYTLLRYQPSALLPGGVPPMGNVNYMYYLVTTQRPLEEKMALFWHHVFATGNSKVDNYDQLLEQIDLFRQQGMGNYRDLLQTVSKNPTMIFWLDNNQNHGTEVNENWGRELLELFSLGAGNYTEVDVREASRAFTGWTFGTKIPRLPYGRFPWKFEYRPEDHDDGVKTFLGHKGNFNGEDIIDIIVRQPACAKFICRHLYNFFVADEPQVAQWMMSPPRDMAAIETLEKAYFDNHYEIRPVLRVLLNSDFFKNARFSRVKTPAEQVVSIIKLVDYFKEGFRPGMESIGYEAEYMGMELYEPPTVEGWHYGKEWIDSGTLLERINWTAEWVGQTDLPGIKDIVDRLMSRGAMSPKEFVAGCLDLIGPVKVTEETLRSLIEFAEKGGELRQSTEEERSAFARKVGQMLQMIVSTQEFQFA